MEKLNNVQVLSIINNNLEYAIKATEATYRAKCFVVLEGDRIEYFAKTKRGAEGYIRKNTFSYYDESIMEMRHAGSDSYIVEICSLDIVDYYNDTNIWFNTLKARWSIGQRNDYMLQQAQEMNVSKEVMDVVEFILNNSTSNSFPSQEMVFGTIEQVEQVQEVEAVEEAQNEVAENVVSEVVEDAPQNVETIQDTQIETESNGKVQLKSITFEWSESNLIPENTIVTTFAEADTYINKVAHQEIGQQGYCKTSYIIEWMNGEQYKGRIDITEKFLHKTNVIGLEIQKELLFAIGQNKPSSWSDVQYSNYITKMYAPSVKAEIQSFLESYKFEDVEVFEQVETTNNEIEVSTQEQSESNITAQMKLNNDKNGVELYFNDKPSEDVRNLLKMNGFRWSKYNKCWYAKQSDKTIKFAESLTGDNTSTNEIAPVEIEPIEFDDINQYEISEQLESRLNSITFYPHEKGYYTNDLQATFNNYKNEVLQLLELTNDIYYQNRAIILLNNFMKKYHAEYVSYLNMKSQNPSWAVTGRGNMNVSKYNKKQDQLHNKMGKFLEAANKFEENLKSLKWKIKKIEQNKQLQAVNNAIENNTLSITFTTSERTATVSGYTETKRAYISPNYFIMKSCGCFRIFDNKSCKEVHSMKTAERLTDAKNYVTYLESLLVNELQTV